MPILYLHREALLVSYDWLEKNTIVVKPPVYKLYETYIRYLFSLRTLIDLFIIIPFFASVVLLSPSYADIVTYLRIFRAFYIFRVFSITNKYHDLENITMLLSQTASYSSIALFSLVLCCLVFMILMGTIFYYIEGGDFTVNDSFPDGAYLVTQYGVGVVPSSFNSIPTSMYFVCTTLSTGKEMLLFIVVIVIYCTYI